jgi:hypothetical protein
MRVGESVTIQSQRDDAGNHVIPSRVIKTIKRDKGTKLHPMEFSAVKNKRGLCVATRIK